MHSALMKIDAFRVLRYSSPDLQDIFEKMRLQKETSGLSSLNRTINGKEVRYENIEKKQVGINIYWFIDFVILRDDHGPGKAGLDNPIQPFDFEEDEKFGYDTAILYDPKTNCIMIQYNHQGVKAKGISEYLTKFDETEAVSYEFKPIIRSDLEKVLADKPLTKKCEIGIDTRYFDINAVDSSIASVINGVTSNNEECQIEITVAVKGKNRQMPKKGQWFFESIKRLFRSKPDGITKLRQNVSDGDSSQEILDWIEAKLSRNETVEVSDGHRLARRNRYNAMKRAFNEWEKNGELRNEENIT